MDIYDGNSVHLVYNWENMNIYSCFARREYVVKIICSMIKTFWKRDTLQVMEDVLETVMTEKLSTDLALQWKYL